MADWDDNKGISLVLVNSPKGIELFESIKEHIKYRESNINSCLQQSLQKPVHLSPKRQQFWQDYCSNDFEYIIKKYTGYGIKGRIKRFVHKGLQVSGILRIINKLVQRA